MNMSNGTLLRKEFDILTCLEGSDSVKSQRKLAEATGMSVGSVNRILNTLTEKGYLSGSTLTEAGYAALEPYRVRRAVFIAAGFGARLVPITLNTPKPLVRVKGVRMIDTLLDAVVAAGIEEIVIVRGYLSEQFDQLKYKYPQITFLENPLYNEAENISSAMVARYLMQNAYVFESDLVLFNPALVTKYQYTSNYLAVPVESTDDWCFEVKNRIITKCGIGGTDCYHMFGISYWSAEDGAKLAEDIQKVYRMPGGKERFWDQVPLEYCIRNYKVEVRPCTFDDIAEVDTYSDLKKLDNTYC